MRRARRVTRRAPAAQDFVSSALPAARVLLVLGHGVAVRSAAAAPSAAPKQLALLGLEDLEQLGVVPADDGAGLRLGDGARPGAAQQASRVPLEYECAGPLLAPPPAPLA